MYGMGVDPETPRKIRGLYLSSGNWEDPRARAGEEKSKQHVREDRVLYRGTKPARVVAVRAVAEHVALRDEFLQLFRGARVPSDRSRREHVARGGDAGDDPQVDPGRWSWVSSSGPVSKLTPPTPAGLRLICSGLKPRTKDWLALPMWHCWHRWLEGIA